MGTSPSGGGHLRRQLPLILAFSHLRQVVDGPEVIQGMEKLNANEVRDVEDRPRVLCPSCLKKVEVFAEESAVCGCTHRFPLADPHEEGPVLYIDWRGRPV